MHFKDMKHAEQAFNDTMERDFIHVLKGTVKRPPEDELRDRITRFLAANCIGTIATCTDNIPRSTPVRYRSRDLTVYIMTEGGGKVYNIRNNPSVCFSVYGNYAGFKTVRGLQLWGTAEIIEQTDRNAYLDAYRAINLTERDDLKEINIDQVQSEMVIIRIEPQRIRFLSFPQGILNRELVLTEGG